MPEENRGRASRRGFGGTSLDHTDMVPTSIAAVTQAPKLMLWTAGVELVVHSSVHKAHTTKGKLKLIVCPLSEDTMKSEVFRSTLLMYYSTRGDPLLKSNMQFISRNGLYSVVKGKLLHIPLL